MGEKRFDLSSLVVSQETIATEAIGGALQGLVSLIQETGEVVPEVAFNRLDCNSRILAYLLGLRAAAILGLGNKRVVADAEAIANVVGVDPQRAREYLSRSKGKFVQKSADGWHLPVTRISAACEELVKKRK